MHKPGQLRIIAGTHRGRCIDFPSIEGLRPTPNRVRETLFNWLQEDIIGLRCADVCAGSGALGFEALSRGASQVIFLEKDLHIVKALNLNVQRLGFSERAKVVAGAAEEWLKTSPKLEGYFLDPSFVHSHPNEWIALLAQTGHLEQAHWVYCERPATSDPLVFPEDWICFREKQAGNVCYALLKPRDER